MIKKEDVRDVLLEGCALTCTKTSKVLRVAADKTEAAAKYCKEHQSSTFSCGFEIKLGPKVFKFGSATN